MGVNGYSALDRPKSKEDHVCEASALKRREKSLKEADVEMAQEHVG